MSDEDDNKPVIKPVTKSSDTALPPAVEVGECEVVPESFRVKQDEIKANDIPGEDTLKALERAVEEKAFSGTSNDENETQ
jgi:hypothetical protein